MQHDSSWNSFQELLTDAKARPGTIRYGSPGGGTTPHMTMVQIARPQNINWIHIPFKGSSEVTNAILGGHIDAVRRRDILGSPGALIGRRIGRACPP